MAREISPQKQGTARARVVCGRRFPPAHLLLLFGVTLEDRLVRGTEADPSPPVSAHAFRASRSLLAGRATTAAAVTAPRGTTLCNACGVAGSCR
eukprot:350380-Chlamydomonas_euryale.AAC.10